MMRHKFIGLASLCLSILIFAPSGFAQTQDDLFNGDILHEIRLYMSPDDFATFKETNFTCEFQELDALAGEVISPLPRVICHFPVEFHWKFNGKDITLPEVSIESHGKGSRSNIKPSFKIDFSRYESRNNFLGLRYLVLRANTQDPSLMHERVAMTFFRKLGLPAPREVHTRLYLNDQYIGLYTIVEQVDPIFTQQNFGESDGYLYAYEYSFPWSFEDLGVDSMKYSPLPFKPENNLVNFAPEPIVQMVQTMNHAPDSQFTSAVSQYFDLTAFFKEVAAENFVADQDCLLGGYLLNNFFLYRFMGTLRSTVLPWDKSNAFWAVNWNIFFNFSSNVVSSRALAVAPDLIAMYRNFLQQAVNTAGGPGGWLEQEITKEYQQIQQAAYDDPHKLGDKHATGILTPVSNADFDAEAAFMIQFARQRSAFVQSQLNSGLIIQ
jgi:spore coat protein CotH